jgi:3-oxoacyl-[acyl-carrier-protein] synthase-3
MKDVYISSLAYQLGDIHETIEEAETKKLLVSAKEQLIDGGFSRHYRCSENIKALDLALASSKETLKKCDLNKNDIGAIVYATCFPINANCGSAEEFERTRDVKHLLDYPASHLQAKLELSQSFVVGIDQQACTSMLGSIRLARSLIASGEIEHALCLTADRFPKNAIYEQSYNLISDGAASVIVSSRPSGYKILASHQITNGAMAQASDDETVGFYFNYTCRLVNETLTKANIKREDVTYIVPQNTSLKGWRILSSLLKIPFAKIKMRMIEDVGHCISGDNIINLKTLEDENCFKKDDIILMVMAGYGLNWQSLLVQKV